MKPITELSQSLVNRIAAGEVIERPASVVKELVENAMDAGATRIDIAIEKGGFDGIRVTDNGGGIPADQLTLAITPHATSKLLTDDDLFRISTFGFRGEALASIAEISQFTIRSRVPDADAGAELSVPGNVQNGSARPLQVFPASCAVGTTIEVRNLFFNTPVRRRFLKSISTEFGYISEAMIRIALAAPQVHFTLTHNGKLVQDLPVTATATSDGRQERIAAIFGNEIGKALVSVISDGSVNVETVRPSGALGASGVGRSGGANEIRISGFAALPTLSRGNNRTQYTFLNHRHIRDRSILAAVNEAYRGLLTVGRFPIVFLWLEIPYDRVDVNVHPTKLEVRFQDSGRVYGLVLSAIRTRFLQTNLMKSIAPSETGAAERKRGIVRTFGEDSEDEGDGRGSGDGEPEESRRIEDRTREELRNYARTGREGVSPSALGRGGVAAFQPYPDSGGLSRNLTRGKGSGTEDTNGATSANKTKFTSEANCANKANDTSQANDANELDYTDNVDRAASAEWDAISETSAAFGAKSAAGTLGTTETVLKPAFTEFLPFSDSGGNLDLGERSGEISGGGPNSDSDSDSDSKTNEAANKARGGLARAETTELEGASDEELAKQIREMVLGISPKPSTPAEQAAFEATLETFERRMREKPALPGGGGFIGGPFRAIQMHRSWLVVESPEGIRIVDQHALHERILYERLKRTLRDGKVPSQTMLIPEPVDLTPVEAATALERREQLAELGVKIEPFGGGTVVVTAYPAISRRIQPVELFRSLLERILTGIRALDPTDLMEGMLETMACKAAVKAGDTLAPDEIQDLLRQSLDCDDAHHCPHGRPSVLTFTNAELEKMFSRT